jgi:hypothetical protein
LRDSLVASAEITYFSGRLHLFTTRLIEAIDHVLANAATYAPDTVRAFASHIRSAERYLSGSTTKDAPYEIEYCLRHALSARIKREFLITTALTDDQDFHFLPSDPWQFIVKTISGYDAKGFDALLVQLGVPRIYCHKPIFCIPLYHELGHFVDVHYRLTDYSLLAHASVHPSSQSHRHEHFADLFAACYVGSSSIETLKTIAPNNPTTSTHPSTADRVVLVEKLLSGQNDPLIEMFRGVMAKLGAGSLGPEFKAPTVKQSFDDIRTYRIADIPELHGIFESAWNYLSDALDTRSPPWVKSTFTEGDIEKVVNDLTEKSVRNKSIRERWASGATPTP